MFCSPLITIGPGVPYGMIKGGGAGYGWGIDTMIDGGGPVGTIIGGGLGNFFGRFIYNGPWGGPGTMICGAGGGKGGSCVKTVFGCTEPGGGSRPEEVKVFNNGNSTVGGTDEIDVGVAEDTAASKTRREIGDNSLSTSDDDETALNKATSVGGGNVLKSSGVADSVLTIDKSAEGGRALSVDDEHKVVNRGANGEGKTGGWSSFTKLSCRSELAWEQGTWEIPSET